MNHFVALPDIGVLRSAPDTNNTRDLIHAQVLPQIAGYLRLPRVLELFPVSPSHFWAGVKSGKYPKPVKLSERCTAWRVEDIQKLLNSYNPQDNRG